VERDGALTDGRDGVVVVVAASVTVDVSAVDVGALVDAAVSAIAPVAEGSSGAAHPPTTKTNNSASAQVRTIKPLMLSITRFEAHE
jgi:hypothetical protein